MLVFVMTITLSLQILVPFEPVPLALERRTLNPHLWEGLLRKGGVKPQSCNGAADLIRQKWNTLPGSTTNHAHPRAKIYSPGFSRHCMARTDTIQYSTIVWYALPLYGLDS